MLKREEVDIDYVLEKYQSIADANPLDVVEIVDKHDGEGNICGQQVLVKDPSRWPDCYFGNSSPIESIAQNQHGITIKFADKLKATADLAKYQGMLSDFNMAINCLKKYGLILIQEDGVWRVQGDESPSQLELDL